MPPLLLQPFCTRRDTNVTKLSRHCEPVTESLVWQSHAEDCVMRFPRQCAHWLGMTWFLNLMTLRRSGVPTILIPFFSGSIFAILPDSRAGKINAASLQVSCHSEGLQARGNLPVPSIELHSSIKNIVSGDCHVAWLQAMLLAMTEVIVTLLLLDFTL